MTDPENSHKPVPDQTFEEAALAADPGILTDEQLDQLVQSGLFDPDE